MIHSVSVDSFGGTMAEMLVESKEMGRINDRMCEIMAENTGKRKDFWKKKLDGNRDIYLTSTEAVKNGPGNSHWRCPIGNLCHGAV